MEQVEIEALSDRMGDMYAEMDALKDALNRSVASQAPLSHEAVSSTHADLHGMVKALHALAADVKVGLLQCFPLCFLVANRPFREMFRFFGGVSRQEFPTKNTTFDCVRPFPGKTRCCAAFSGMFGSSKVRVSEHQVGKSFFFFLAKRRTLVCLYPGV